MPDNGKISDRDKVLCDGNGGVKVENDVPPASWYKHSLTGSLKNLQLQENKL